MRKVNKYPLKYFAFILQLSWILNVIIWNFVLFSTLIFILISNFYLSLLILDVKIFRKRLNVRFLWSNLKFLIISKKLSIHPKNLRIYTIWYFLLTFFIVNLILIVCVFCHSKHLFYSFFLIGLITLVFMWFNKWSACFFFYIFWFRKISWLIILSFS